MTKQHSSKGWGRLRRVRTVKTYDWSRHHGILEINNGWNFQQLYSPVLPCSQVITKQAGLEYSHHSLHFDVDG
jgi:hypothetical protein